MMLARKILVILVALFVMSTLVAIVSCAPTPTPSPSPPPAKETAAPPSPVPTATPKPLPPTAVLNIVPVAAGVIDPNVITATLGATTTLYFGATGLQNSSLGVPVHLSASVADPKNPAKKFAWTLTKPSESKAALKDPAAQTTEFTPDVPGYYKVDVVASNDAGAGPMASVQIHIDTYVGVTNGNCKQCHPAKVAEWEKTAHATKLKREIDGRDDPPNSHYGESCIRCHTVGYFPGVSNGGFADIQAKLGYKFPTTQQIQTGKGNWDAMPAELKNVANIQCENCHGPAKEHVTKGVPTMAKSLDEGVCNICHAAGGYQTRGIELKNAKHSEETSTAWNYPVGPDHQACVRCHSGAGYVTFLENPTNMAAWDNEKQTVVCSVCHDPHSEENKFQLRIVGKPVQLPFAAKDAGLSATCQECHNGRENPANAIKGQFPHYSAIAEMMNYVAGVTYGQDVPNSPHGELVGSAPIKDPRDQTGKALLFGGVTPGPCVTCHMWPTITDAKDPYYLKVGGHSFNTVSPDGKLNYTAACKQCHGDLKTFNFTAKADYDGDGKVEGVQDEVKGLLGVLWKALEDKGVKKVDTGYPYATLPQNADDKIRNAWFNYRTVYGVMWGVEDGKPSPGQEGKAQAIHNFKRAVSLLQLSYKDLTGKDMPNATLMK